MDRKEELNNLFNDVDPNQKALVNRLIGEVVFIEKQLGALKELPFIRVHPKDLSKQEITPAGKQYKDLTATYMNAIRILCSLLSKSDGDNLDDPVSDFLKSIKND